MKTPAPTPQSATKFRKGPEPQRLSKIGPKNHSINPLMKTWNGEPRS